MKRVFKASVLGLAAVGAVALYNSWRDMIEGSEVG